MEQPVRGISVRSRSPSGLNKLAYLKAVGTMRGPHGMRTLTQSPDRRTQANVAKTSLTSDSAFVSVLGVKWSQVQILSARQ